MTSSLQVFLGRNKRFNSKSGKEICKYEKGFWSKTETKAGIYEPSGPTRCSWMGRSRGDWGRKRAILSRQRGFWTHLGPLRTDIRRTVRGSMLRNTFWKRQDTWEEQFENINRQIKQINETTQIEPSQPTPINVQEQEFVELEDFRRALDGLEQKMKIQEIFLKNVWKATVMLRTTWCWRLKVGDNLSVSPSSVTSINEAQNRSKFNF